MRHLLCLLLLTLVAVAKEAPWVTVAPAGGRFSVCMPAPPKASQSQSSSPLGDITTQVLTCTRPWGSYTIAYSDLPGAAVTFARGRVFDDARKEMLKDASAVELSFVDSPRGKELMYQNQRLQGWTQICLVGSRLYIADVRVKKGTLKSKQVDPFFKSLTLQEEE